jgi:PhnB protein
MPEKPQPIPPGFHALTPHITVRNAAQAIDFYKSAFGAELLQMVKTPDGRVMHASLKINDSVMMLNDEFPEWGTLSPLSTAGSGVIIHFYTDNVDEAFDRAVSAGAQVKMPLMDQFWGARYGLVADPFGHKWSLAQHIKDPSPEEMERGKDAALAMMSPKPDSKTKTA